MTEFFVDTDETFCYTEYKKPSEGANGMKRVITIGRQFGSGGREIGVTLAESLGIPYYDKELLKRAAKESGLCEHLFESFDEKPKSLLYSLAMDSYSFGNLMTPYGTVEQDVFLATFNTVKRVAQEGPCVMIGRCADYALRDADNCLNLFIYAPLAERVKRISQVRGLSPEKAKDMINKMDKQRASYYNYYTSKKWGSPASYDFCIDSSKLGVAGTVELIRYILEKSE